MPRWYVPSWLCAEFAMCRVDPAPSGGMQKELLKLDNMVRLPLIQEGQLSVSGERMCTVPVNRLED